MGDSADAREIRKDYSPLGRPGALRYLPPWVLASVAYATLSLAIFGDALFAAADLVITHRQGDISFYFTRFRQFGFDELRNGNFPLWNPYTYSGAPFIGTVQSAMLYPLNFIFYFLPLAKAINLSIVFHHALTGILMYAWARGRSLQPLAAFVSGILLMFGSAYFMRAFAGHLTMLNALAWTPLIFLAVDRIFDNPSLKWALVGAFATSMQTLAGYPQSAYASALALAMYCAFRYIPAPRKIALTSSLAIVAVLPLLMCAMPLWMGFDAGQESLRGGGVDYEFAATFSLPPENLLTVIAPRLFGDHVNFPYWGRWSIWDASLYFGIGGFALMLFGIARGEGNQKRFSTSIMLVFVLICLGAYTPAFKPIFDFVPGFNLFRAPSKYAFHAAIFAALLSGIGLQALLERKSGARALSILFFVLSAGIGAVAVALRLDAIRNNENVRAEEAIQWMRDSGETFLLGEIGPFFGQQVSVFSSLTLLIPAGLCLVVAVALWHARTYRSAALVLAAISMVDAIAHAASYRENFLLEENDRPSIEALYAHDPGDYRILNLSGLDHSVRNQTMMIDHHSIWGYDPLILRRTAEFVEFTQRHDQSVYAGERLSPFSQWDSQFHELDITKFPPAGPWPNTYHPLLRMLRCRYVIPDVGTTPQIDRVAITKMGNDLPRFYFADRAEIIEDSEATFEALAAPGFDLEGTVILDRAPGIMPAPAVEAHTLSVVDESSDHVTLEIHASTPTVLVMTDAYSEHWKAWGLTGSVQSEYEVLPANHAIRAVPLQAGDHIFRIEFLPDSYVIGRWVSMGSTILFGCLMVVAAIQALAEWAGGRKRKHVRRRRIVSYRN